MNHITTSQHDKNTFGLAFSYLLERASYYGIRTLLFLYMLKSSFAFSESDAAGIYGWFTGSLVFTQILGAILGDLVLGNKKAMVIGGITQALGAFSLSIPTLSSLYIGIILIMLGGGLYSPNITSMFGKHYINKPRLLDSGFTILYLASNLGALIGVVLIGYFGEVNFPFAFILAGILVLSSIVFPLISSEPTIKESPKNTITLNKKVSKILLAVLLISLFGAFSGAFSTIQETLAWKFGELFASGIPESFLPSISSSLIFLISIVACIVWTYRYSSQFLKMVIGFILAAISIGISTLIPQSPETKHLWVYLLSLFVWGIAETHIMPIVYSVLTQYMNPKYLTIAISLSDLASGIFLFIPALYVSYLYEDPSSFYENPTITLTISAIGMGIIGLGLLGYVFTQKDR